MYNANKIYVRKKMQIARHMMQVSQMNQNPNN